MRLLHDEQAYRRVLGDFVASRLDAGAFILRFRHLWKCDGVAGVDRVPAIPGTVPAQPGLYGVLDSVNALCATYTRGLPPGCDYRVSEEQFRKEVGSLTSLALSRPQRPAPRTPRPA